MRYRRLGRTGLDVSILGFGASPLGEEFGRIEPAEGERAVHAAIDRGINYFDTAPYYGRSLSEKRLGQALRGRRDKAIIATKCCRSDVNTFDFSAARVRASIDESLKRLGTDHVDIYQIHDIEYGDRRQIIEETIPAAREVQQAGKTRFIGVTGLQLGMLADAAVRGDVDVVLSYVRYNLVFQDLDTLLRPLVEERGIGLVNASPLLMGALTQGSPPDWHPAPPELLEAAAKAAQACREEGVDIARLALRFALDYEPAATTLVGMATTAQLEANLAVLDEAVDPTLIKKVRSLLAPFGERIWPSGREENWD